MPLKVAFIYLGGQKIPFENYSHSFTSICINQLTQQLNILEYTFYNRLSKLNSYPLITKSELLSTTYNIIRKLNNYPLYKQLILSHVNIDAVF